MSPAMMFGAGVCAAIIPSAAGMMYVGQFWLLKRRCADIDYSTLRGEFLAQQCLLTVTVCHGGKHLPPGQCGYVCDELPGIFFRSVQLDPLALLVDQVPAGVLPAECAGACEMALIRVMPRDTPGLARLGREQPDSGSSLGGLTVAQVLAAI
jgi:hypothetical protein